MRLLSQLGVAAALVLQLPHALADDAITNFMSPIVSYQYPNDFNSEALSNGGVQSPFVSFQYLENFSSAALTNGGILSPIISYQYFEWPGDDVLQLSSSRRVSYFYQGNEGPLIFLQGRVTDTNGAPLSGATVSVAFGVVQLGQAVTDARGDYVMPLGGGVYALTASASGHAKSSRVLTLSTGTATQSFRLASLASAPVQQNVNRSQRWTSSPARRGVR